jgi:phosphoribosylanthranilate isomerase
VAPDDDDQAKGMNHVHVKIEGLRDPQTAARIAGMGADAVGLVFADSPRRVTPEAARQVVAALPPEVWTIGVFVNAEAEEINRVARETGIGCVQLHGDEPPTLLAKIALPCVKAFRVRSPDWLAEMRGWLAGVPAGRKLAAVLLDAYNPSARGGTGNRFNWQWVAEARGRGELEGLPPIVLAGGLNPTCVGEAVHTVRPWAVDVASGVESSPGVKDLAKVQAFLDAVRGAEAE